MIELLALAVIVVIAVMLVKITPETRRYAVFVGGQFEGLKGPGLVFKFPRSNVKWLSLAIGDRGTLASTEIAAFGDSQVPVEVSVGTANSRIRIIGFKGPKVIVRSDE